LLPRNNGKGLNSMASKNGSFQGLSLLGKINLVVYFVSFLGSIFMFLTSFGQCKDDYCYETYTNTYQLIVSIAYFMISILIFAFIASFDNYVNRKN
jgi:hypothetical protein